MGNGEEEVMRNESCLMRFVGKGGDTLHMELGVICICTGYDRVLG